MRHRVSATTARSASCRTASRTKSSRTKTRTSACRSGSCRPTGGEPQQLTDEPLGVESFRFAKSAAVLALFAPVLPGVEHDKQRETASERRKKHTSARHFRQQPVRHWDHWLHQNDNMADTHLIAYAADGTKRVDLTPEAKHELSIEPALDVSADGKQVAVTWQTPGQDRETRHRDPPDRRRDEVGAHARRRRPTRTTSRRCSRRTARRSPWCARRAPPPTAMRPTLTLIDVATGTMRELGKAFDAWPHPGDWTADGKQIVFTCRSGRSGARVHASTSPGTRSIASRWRAAAALTAMYTC